MIGRRLVFEQFTYPCTSEIVLGLDCSPEVDWRSLTAEDVASWSKRRSLPEQIQSPLLAVGVSSRRYQEAEVERNVPVDQSQLAAYLVETRSRPEAVRAD